MLLRSAALLLALAASAAADYPPPPASCSGRVNARPLLPFASAGVLSNATARNGRRYDVPAAALGNGSAPLAVIHLWGSVFDQNFAYGTLMRAEVAALAPRALAYLFAQVNASIDLSWLTPAVRELVLEFGVEAALDLTYNLTAPFSPPHWADALAGLAAGSGVDAASLRRVAMIAEWTRASCSMLGAWGAASASGALVQLRALDWDTDGPFQEFPMLAVYHPAAPGDGFHFATLGWAGMLGAITGVSSSGLALSEKVWDAYKGTHATVGYAWNFLFQDILQFDLDTDQALSRIATANRTCAVWLGLGDAHGNGGGGSFKAVQYSHQEVGVLNDRNFPAYPAHDRFAQLVFINKHVQPSAEPCMNDLMHAAYGSLTGRAAAQFVAALEQTGDMHVMAVDFAGAGELLVSNAGVGGALSAYDAPIVSFNLSALWAEPPPQV
jgi:isopenicillin-N N-acyltransferase-like protein